jgi:hemolysin activation/secretion protein
MTAGGADSVRGYLEAERAADNGLRGTLELRSPGWQPQAGQGPAWAGAWRVTGLGFIDAAWLQNLQVLAPTAARHRLLGAGLGLRANGPRNLTVEADLAEALLAGDATARRALRAHARLLWGF